MLAEQFGRSKALSKEITDLWQKTGVITVREYHSERQAIERQGIFVAATGETSTSSIFD